MDKLNNISENLKSLMENNGYLTLSEISRRTNIPQATLHNVLSGKTHNPRHLIKDKLAKFFGITINQLVGKEELLDSKDNSFKKIPTLSWESDIQLDTILVEKHDSFEISFKIDNNIYEPMFPKNSIIICNSKVDYGKGKLQIIVAKNGIKKIGTLINQEGINILITKTSDGKKSAMNFIPSAYDEVYSIKQIRYDVE
ncbi:helix-turn-helix transcriptional regulator [Thiotrichales bacterium 19X7-9]|nr:helix-turn-helix transcriptional regulator [Thiotrichales bacterium 19X7-9]